MIPWSRAMWVTYLRGDATLAASITTAMSSAWASCHSVTHVGGASSMRPSSRPASTSAGRNQAWSWISLPSMATSWAAGAGATKNHVENRLGASGGGHQYDNVTSASMSSSRAASSLV